jgi:hypothetical protein
MGLFSPPKAEPDIWMRCNGDVYEYISVYVDALAIIAKKPHEIIDELETKYKFKLKGTGSISFHLGMDFLFGDSDDVLCMAPTWYIEKMITSYASFFGTKPNTKYLSPPLEKQG